MALNLGWIDNPLQVDQVYVKDTLCAHTDDTTNDERLAENPPIYFKRNLFNTITVAQANHIQVLLSTQAYYLKSNETAMPDWRRTGLNQHNAIVAQLAQQTGVPFYDLMANIAQNEKFWMDDGTHQTVLGAHEQASEYAAYLAANHLIKTDNARAKYMP